MSNSWRKAYDELKEYITKNPGIEIGTSTICISSDVRPEFYRRFDKVRACFLKDNYPAQLEKGGVLSKKWDEVSRETRDGLKLETIDMDTETRWFLLDPMDGLIRGLSDPLFDVLKGTKTLSEFEQTAARVVEDRFNRYYHEGYQSWATMSLLKLLSTDKAYYVPPAAVDKDPSSQDEMHKVYDANVPDVEETSKISFTHSLKYSFLVPNIIGHSVRLNLFAAFISDFDYNESRWKACRLSPQRKWHEMSDITGEFGKGKLWPNLAIYTSGRLQELTVVADNSQVAQPDIIVEFREREGWYDKEGLELVRRHYNVLKPKLGSFVVCLEPVPEAALKELEPKSALQPVPMGVTLETKEQPAVTSVTPETTVQPSYNMRILGVGYDITKLEPIVKAIVDEQTRPEEATAGNTPA